VTTPRIVKRQLLGARIKAARLAVGVSQERMAERIGTSRRHYIRIENGEHRPGAQLLDAIARETGTDATELADDDEEDASMDLYQALRREIREIVREEVRA
jgi:transcriptional regulator with XRE-family HTH domain